MLQRVGRGWPEGADDDDDDGKDDDDDDGKDDDDDDDDGFGLVLAVSVMLKPGGTVGGQ